MKNKPKLELERQAKTKLTKELIIKSSRTEIIDLLGWTLAKLLKACKILGYPDFQSYQLTLRLNYIKHHPELTAKEVAKVFNCTRRTVTSLRRQARGCDCYQRIKKCTQCDGLPL